MSYANPSSHIYSYQSPYASSTPPAPPPKPTNTTGPPLPPHPPSANTPHQLEPPELDSSQTTSPQPSQHHLHVPPIEATWLPETLKETPTQDLQTLLESPDLQNALLDNPATTHRSIPASQAPLHPLIESNMNLATHVADLERRLASSRQEVQSRLLSLRALEQSHRTKLSETESALASFSPMGIYQRLSAAGQEQEALVRGLEESWLEEDRVAGEREVGEFVRRVREGKKIAVLRRERKERWDEGRVGGWR